MEYNIKNLLAMIHRDSRAAAMILTRIPVYDYDDDAPDTAHSYWAFPLVGIAISAIPAMIAVTLLNFGIPALAVAALMIFGIILITGGLHYDGLADLGDSFGGHDPEQRLKIMHDSAIGCYGMLALIIALIVAASCLAAIGDQSPQKMAGAMIATAAISRGMMGLQRWQYAPPNPGGLADMTGTPDQQIMLIGLLLAFVFGIIFLGPYLTLAAFIGGIVATLLLGLFLKRWIGGVNGDGLGATQQISEVVMLLIITVMI